MSTAQGVIAAPVLSAKERTNGIGAASLVVGVVGLTLAALVIFFPLAWILGIIAMILGFVGLQRVKAGRADNKMQAQAGIIIGGLALVLASFVGIQLGSWINAHQGDFRSFWSCITSAPTDAQQEACGRQLGNALD
jgi:Domain of unknown function (DUF4190)